MLFSCLFIRQKQKRGIRILASRRRSVRLGSDSLAAARSHSGSDSHPRLSFIALVPLRYAAGATFTTEPVRIRLSKGKGGFEFSRLDDARSGSALTAVKGCHSLPSPFESRLPKGKGGFEFSQLDAARSGSALTVSLRLGHTRVLTAIQGCHTLPSCRCATSKAVIHYRARSNPLVKRKRGDSNSRVSTPLGQARL